ncbi:MAG: PhoH family protein [Pelovirga sp.]
MEKVYILDTNVLLHDATSIFCFEEHEVVLPLGVIEELDRFKKDGNENGRNARRVSRELDRLRLTGILTNGGVKLNNGGLLRVVVMTNGCIEELPQELRSPSVDHQLLALALQEKQKRSNQVILVTKDINLRIKAHAVGIAAQDYKTDKISLADLYTGTISIDLVSSQIDQFFRDQHLQTHTVDLPPHANVTLQAVDNERQKAIGRFDPRQEAIVPLQSTPKEGYWGILPRNLEQKFSLELLTQPDIHLVTLIGRAGTGKTLLALAAGLHMVTEANTYKRLLVSRPVFPMGRDLGFLPGDVEEKLSPWMQPINDNLDLLLTDTQGRNKHRRHQELKDLDIISVEPLTYIRGRSIPRQYMVVDEAQNLTPHEVKTIITRAGEGTKIVLTGDPEQIDNPYIDAGSNGLTYVVERFRDSPLAGHIQLSRGERSILANAASERL